MSSIGRHVSKLAGYAPALPTPFGADGASSIVPDFKRDSSLPASRLSCASPVVNASWTGKPWYQRPHEFYWSTRLVTCPLTVFCSE